MAYAYNYVRKRYHNLAHLVHEESKRKIPFSTAISLVYNHLSVTPLLKMMEVMAYFEEIDPEFLSNTYYRYFLRRIDDYFMIPRKMIYEPMFSRIWTQFSQHVIRKFQYEQEIKND